ncbi:hypothetical protein BDV41DRAFT_577507 [Aspergillus transmontanensis]|uniref:Uncharacterized protein n=1 Tax=Aspergillus transmontanensis TaxID=1034304 RepID=A0A5N6VVN1_9EURO|nr:hypothetical protein BDV41DRAFT_577507 [Aspergillus transmontanensis]
MGFKLRKQPKSRLNAGSSATPKSQVHWRPCYLRRRVLLLFLLIFVAMIAALEALHRVSSAHYGLGSSVENLHYSWTYGPTAILTVVAAFWSRVEFQAKQNAPWQAMQENPQNAHTSVLMDYVSMIQPLSLLKSFKNGHLMVAAGVICSMLLRILTIFSTGLLSLQQLQVPKYEVPIQLLQSFSANNLNLASAGSKPYNLLNAIIFEGLPYPNGTNANVTFQEFVSDLSSRDALITANVDGLAADLDCETANITVRAWGFQDIWYLGDELSGGYTEDIQVATSTCTITGNLLGNDTNYHPSRYHAMFTPCQCEGSPGPDGKRIVVTVADISVGNHSAPYNVRNVTEGWVTGQQYNTMVNKTLNRSVALICRPTLSLSKFRAQLNSSDSLLTANLENIGPSSNLIELLPWDVASSVLTFNDSGSGSLDPVTMQTNHRNISNFPLPFKFGSYLVGVNGSVDQLFDAETTRQAVSSYYRAMAAQIMKLTVAKGNASSSVGSALVNENRVIVTQLSLRMMQACLGATSLMAIATIIYVPSSKDTFVPWNPNRISSIAAIISNSSFFRKVLQGTGAVPMGVLEGLLVGRKYYTQWALGSNNFSIEIADDGRGEFDLDYEDISLTWRPFPGFIIRMITFITVALVITALEATLHVSQANNGLGDVSTDTYTHFIWTLVPALAMVLISLLFMSLDFNTRCLAPYADLRRAVEGSTFTQSMEINYLDSLSLVNAVKSVRMKHFAVSATTTAALISSLLTIISSGLYSAINVPLISKFDFIQETTWRDMADTYLSALYQQIADDEGEGVAIAGYILLDNLTFPKWTYDDLAFPQISPKSSIAGNSEGIFVDVTIPALRTSLSCKLQSSEELNATVVHNDNGITNSTLLSLDFVKFPCMENEIETTQNNWFGPISPHSIFGYLYEPNCVNSSSNAEEHNYVLPYHHQITYVWGEMGNGAKVQSVMALSCLDSPETVNTTTRFSLPSLEITQGMPPITDESSAEIAPHLFVPFLKDAYLFDGSNGTATMRPFFEVLVSSKYSIPRTDLGDESKKETVAEAIKHQHKLIKAQQFSQFVRASANGTLANDLLHGNITSRDRQRLIQDAVSTRTLEALLVSMIILGIWGSALLNTDAILPKNPCSIASVASLLADSNFLDRYKKVIDDPSSKSTAQALFPNSRFLLDWWNDGPLSGTSTEHRGLETNDRFTIYLIDEVNKEPVHSAASQEN